MATSRWSVTVHPLTLRVRVHSIAIVLHHKSQTNNLYVYDWAFISTFPSLHSMMNRLSNPSSCIDQNSIRIVIQSS